MFVLRGWLNWLVIQRGLALENWQRWPAAWLVDVIATVVATLLLVPAWGIYRLVANLMRAFG